VDLLARQAAELQVEAVGIVRAEAADELRARLDAWWPTGVARPQIHAGAQATEELARREADVVLNAVTGAQGLRATLASLDAGLTVALANKESLVAGGPLVTSRAAPGQLVPVDSEHSALAQCLRGGSRDEVRRLILTASGGPFRGRRRSELEDVTPERALAHPTWDMGKLVTTNSATLVNKGLEMIEAHLLFDIPYDRIDVVVHPQSFIHSMVEFVDGSTLAQASPPDMRLPISLALDWPHRVPEAAPAVDWTSAQSWTFEPLDSEAFPAVALARAAGEAGGCAPAVFNAANEEMVAAFHDGHIGFLQIVDTVAGVVDEWLSSRHAAAGIPGTVEDVEDAEAWARARARSLAVRV
jgi:1-deoxy-D-xylulose-5-phosphate reductoisomerase